MKAIDYASLALTTIITTFLISHVAEAAPDDVGARTPVTLHVSDITKRDSRGKVHLFLDPRQREFAVSYDLQMRVQSIMATRGPNIDDIVLCAYAPDGRLAAVRFRRGYSIYFAYRPDGSRIVRDAFGTALIPFSKDGRDQSFAATTGDLVRAATQVEALLHQLSNAPN